MGKFIKVVSFCAATFFAGALFATAAYGDEVNDTIVDPAPRAIQCSAAFELMNQIAPNWFAEEAVSTAQAAWAKRVNFISGDASANAQEQVSNEMSLLADSLAVEPTYLSGLAAQCVADAPI